MAPVHSLWDMIIHIFAATLTLSIRKRSTAPSMQAAMTIPILKVLRKRHSTVQVFLWSLKQARLHLISHKALFKIVLLMERWSLRTASCHRAHQQEAPPPPQQEVHPPLQQEVHTPPQQGAPPPPQQEGSLKVQSRQHEAAAKPTLGRERGCAGSMLVSKNCV